MSKYVILVVSTVLIISSFVINSQKKVATDVIENKENVQEITKLEQETITYVAKSLDGYVAIFVPGNLEPYLITDISIYALPPYDQELLKTGINLDEKYTLANLIEDFDG